jgi:putative membrane protein
MRNQRNCLSKALVVGAICGLGGTVAMTQFQILWKKLSKDTHRPESSDASTSKEEEKEDSTMKAAAKISSAIGTPLSREQRRKAGTWIHYGFGTAVGSIFGLATERAPRSLRAVNPLVSGAGYGTLVFLAAHELAVPALKLSSNPLKEPVSDQIAELASHLVYGIGTALAYEALAKVKN